MNKNFLSASSIIFAIVILIALANAIEAGVAGSNLPLKCYTCDPNTCADMKNKEPQECTVDNLKSENLGPSKLADFSYIPFNQNVHLSVPEFLCMKVEAFGRQDEKFVIRRCQLKLAGNESCADFYRNVNNEKEPKTYTNASCYLCADKNGCNSSGFVYIWAPLLLFSIMLCLYMK